MKRGLTSFDIRVLLQELQSLSGAYLDKIYQDGASFIFRFNVPQGGKPEVFVKPGQWLFVTEGLEKPPQPPPLAAGLRKVLTNARLREVRQRGFDRILLLDFEKESPYTLVLEMFGKGNLVLLKDGEIQTTLSGGRWKTREVRRGVAYEYPPEGVNPIQLERDAFRQILEGHDEAVVKALATLLGLGGLYAEEVVVRADIPKDRPANALSEGNLGTLYDALRDLLDQLGSPAPMMVLRDGPLDVVPFPLKVYEGYETRPFPTMSGALQEFVQSRVKGKEEAKEDPGIARIQRRIRRQERTLAEALEEAEVAQETADYLYAHYQEVDLALRRAREGTLREEVDPAQKTLRFNVGQTEVEVRYEESVDANARRFYDERKALIERAARIKVALEESQGELKRVQKAAKKRERRPSYPPSKRFWFDTYRWTVSSGGSLILGGRNARSNEKLVRKHLRPGDRYAHADITGAPSVVIKDGADADEQTLREASHFALLQSKAWKLGLGSGSAFWVTPDQVSKTAESGEHVKTGSFVIRGKRNYVHNLPLVLAVGEAEVQGSRRVIAGGPEAIQTLSPRYLLLKPAGPVRRRDLVAALSTSFEVPPDEIERILPAGTFDVTKAHGVRWDGPGTG